MSATPRQRPPPPSGTCDGSCSTSGGQRPRGGRHARSPHRPGTGGSAACGGSWASSSMAGPPLRHRPNWRHCAFVCRAVCCSSAKPF